jgi:hypothetical protein
MPDFDLITNLPRYLRSLRARIGKARDNPGKYRELSDRLEPYTRELDQLNRGDPSRSDTAVREYAAMVEEFRISLFAQQEVGTRCPVSEKRLDEKLHQLRAPVARKDAP